MDVLHSRPRGGRPTTKTVHEVGQSMSTLSGQSGSALTWCDLQDNSGTIEREEFLSLPQVSSNPLATRYDMLYRIRAIQY